MNTVDRCTVSSRRTDCCCRISDVWSEGPRRGNVEHNYDQRISASNLRLYCCFCSHHPSYQDTTQVSESVLGKLYRSKPFNNNSSARPIYNIVERLVGLDPQELPPATGLLGLSGYTRGGIKFAIRIIVLAVIIILAILVPSFDLIMALSGSAMAFSICIILPVAFHLKMFGKELGMKEKMLNWFLIVVCSILAVLGTVWVFLPKELRERMDGVA